MEFQKKIREVTTLDEYLDSWHFSRKAIHLMKMEKRIKINGKTVVSDCPLLRGDIITLDIFKDEPSKVEPKDSELEILYEDDVILIVNKPYDILVHDDGNDQITLDNLVAGYYQKTGQMHPILHVHRLDRLTTGAILYCKQSFMMPYFDYCLAQKKIDRQYIALVDGIIKHQLTIDKPIGRDRHVSGKYRVSPDGQRAITVLTPLKVLKGKTLVRCQLKTGRTHQIRVHLSAIGHPITGDQLYGGSPYSRLMLHSCSISLTHPLTGQDLFIKSKIKDTVI